MCSVLNLPIVAVYTVRLADGTFKGYIIVGIPPDDVSSWSSSIQTPFEGCPMPNEYAAVDSAADAIIQFLCTHKNVKVDDANYGPRMQGEQMCVASATYHQALAEQAQRQTDACDGVIFSPSSWEPQEKGMMNIAARFFPQLRNQGMSIRRGRSQYD
jgi:hypothetical protein